MEYKLRLPGLAADSVPTWQDTMAGLVTYERVARGMKPYKRSAIATQCAQVRAQDLMDRGYFSHTLPQGGTGYVIELANLGMTNYRWAGENLARNAGFSDPVKIAMQGLMDSPEHRDNILAGTDIFTHIGIAHVTNGYRHWFVQIFLGLDDDAN